MQFFSNLKLTSKIVLLVALLGTLAVIITFYSMASLYAVDRDYRALLDKDAQASTLVNAALLDLSDASRLVFAVLTEQEAAKMRASQLQLDQQQEKFLQKINTIRPLVRGSSEQLDQILQQQQRVFALAAEIIDAAARWRGDRSLNIIHQQFDPELNALRKNMDNLRDQIIAHFQDSSAQLNAQTRRTLINTSVSFSLALAAIIGLSAYLSLTQISRPITQLTHVMSRLSARDYQQSIGYTERHDEVGKMAHALQVFRNNMQRADRLELEAAASAEARRISQQLTDLTDAMPGAVFQLLVKADGDQQFIFLSGNAEGFIGHQALHDKRSGLRLDAVRTSRTAASDQALEQAISNSLTTLQPFDVDMQVARAEGSFWLKTLATAKRSEDGSTLFNGIWLDISELKAQARALEEAKELAEQAAKAKASFLATMSHEIRTPMNAILGLTQLSLKHPLELRQRQRLDKILRAGQHLLGIINDILDFSKIDGGHLVAETVVFSPQQLLDDVQQMLEVKAADKGLDLHIAKASDLPFLLGDPLRISQILLNYASNAIKFSDRGRIHLSVELQHEADDRLYLYGQVVDQGIGLTPQQCSVLFQPFQQADASITRRFGGTGLGLAISRNLAELMGGSVGVISQPDEGSTFWFRVAVAEADQTHIEALAPASVALVNQALQGIRVLLVDDNELNRLVASELLAEQGIRVDQACDGHHALSVLEHAADGTYDVVLMDMMMPELDGLSATRLLRDNPRFKQLPVIAMTANASPQDVAQCLAAGMNAHVAKPIDEQHLWKALVDHCLLAQQQTQPTGTAFVTETPATAEFSPTALEQLKRLVAPERFSHMLVMLIDDCRQRAEHFKMLSERPDPQQMQQQAHDLISTAGHAGFQHLSARAHELRNVLQQDDMAQAQHLALEIHVALLVAVERLQRHFGMG